MKKSDPRNVAMSGKMGGMAVQSMVKEMEKRMAAGEHVSAAPTDSAEAELLHWVKQENEQSARNAQK